MTDVAGNHPLAPMVRKLSRWSPLSASDQDAILKLPCTFRRLAPENYIVREGDEPTHTCLLVSGFACRQKVMGGGSRQILSIQVAGDVVDLQNSLLGTADHSVQALTKVEVASIPRSAIKRIAFDRPAVGMAMWYDTLVDGSIHREWTANIGRRDAHTAIAHLLCEFGVRLQAAGLGTLTRYELPMTQEQLADCVGLTPVHVSRTLKALREEGLAVQSTRSVVIQNWNRLAEVGEFDARYLHLDERRPSGVTTPEPMMFAKPQTTGPAA